MLYFLESSRILSDVFELSRIVSNYLKLSQTRKSHLRLLLLRSEAMADVCQHVDGENVL